MPSEATLETYYDDGLWKNRIGENQRVRSVYPTREQAVVSGRLVAVERGLEHVIYAEDGTVCERVCYAKKPRRSSALKSVR